jgi:hypothetical protein
MAKLYSLRAGEGYFDAGVLPDGRQALMAAFYDATFAILFAPDGTFVEYLERPNAVRAPNESALRAWQTELGFTPQTIRVEEFYVDDREVGIAELPSHYQELVDDPESQPDPDERAQLMREIEQWQHDGNFVLYWGNDLWLDASGHVASS